MTFLQVSVLVTSLNNCYLFVYLIPEGKWLVLKSVYILRGIIEFLHPIYSISIGYLFESIFSDNGVPFFLSIFIGFLHISNECSLCIHCIIELSLYFLVLWYDFRHSVDWRTYIRFHYSLVYRNALETLPQITLKLIE